MPKVVSTANNSCRKQVLNQSRQRFRSGRLYSLGSWGSFTHIDTTTVPHAAGSSASPLLMRRWQLFRISNRKFRIGHWPEFLDRHFLQKVWSPLQNSYMFLYNFCEQLTTTVSWWLSVGSVFSSSVFVSKIVSLVISIAFSGSRSNCSWNIRLCILRSPILSVYQDDHHH